MSGDMSESQDERRILREITTTVNNSPGLLVDRSKCTIINDTVVDIQPEFSSLNLLEISGEKVPIHLKINESIEDIQLTNNTLNLLELSGQKVPIVLKLDEITQHFNSESNGTNLLDATNTESAELKETKATEHNANINTLQDSSQKFDETVAVHRGGVLNTSELSEEQNTDFNDTVDLYLTTCEGVSSQDDLKEKDIHLQLNDTVDTQLSTGVFSLKLNATLDKTLQLNRTTESLESLSNALNHLDIAAQKLNLTTDIAESTHQSLNSFNNSDHKSHQLNITNIEIDLSKSTTNSLDVSNPSLIHLNNTVTVESTNKELIPSTVSEPSVLSLNQTSDHCKPDNLNNTSQPISCEDLNQTAESSHSTNVTEITESVEGANLNKTTELLTCTSINETTEHVKCDSTELDATKVLENEFSTFVEASDKVASEIDNLSSAEISGHYNPEIEHEEPLAELNDTLTLSPLQTSDEPEANLASEEYVTPTDEIFQDPTAFDFLLHKSESTASKSKRLESLYVKFDPLYSSSMLPQSMAVGENEERDENKTADLSVFKHKETDLEASNIELPNIEAPKRNSLAAIDKLVSVLSTEKTKLPVEIKETKEAENVLFVDVAKELETVKLNVLELEAALDKQKHINDELVRRNNELTRSNAELQKKYDETNAINEKLHVVVDEYEQSISRIIAKSETERATLKNEKEKLQEELRVSNQHLHNSEAAFNDVHEKYERMKSTVHIHSSNEKMLREAIQENIKTIEAIENRYQVLKAHASEQLERANTGLAASKKQHEAELVKERAKLAKAELQCKTLAETIDQKMKENEELTKILDGLISGVGQNH